MLRFYILAKVDACSASISAAHMHKRFMQLVQRPGFPWRKGGYLSLQRATRAAQTSGQLPSTGCAGSL